MISTRFTTAPTGFLGMGSVDVCPAGFLSMEAVRAQGNGTGLSVAGPVRLRPITAPMSLDVEFATRNDGITQHDGTTQNDGTTLGNPSSRRPLS